MGYDNYTQTFYANKEFLLNCVDYLVGEQGFIASRSRDVKLRKLDVMKVKEQRTLFQLLNMLIPSGIILLAGAVIIIVRKKKYKKK